MRRLVSVFSIVAVGRSTASNVNIFMNCRSTRPGRIPRVAKAPPEQANCDLLCRDRVNVWSIILVTHSEEAAGGVYLVHDDAGSHARIAVHDPAAD
jgi:hypothetical protein